MSASTIVGLVRNRLIAADHEVSLFRQIDEDTDEFPRVGVYLADEGETCEPAQEGVSIDRRIVFMEITVAILSDDGDDELAILQALEGVRDDLMPELRTDIVQALSGIANQRVSVTAPRLSVDIADVNSNLLVGHIELTVTYYATPAS